MTAYEQGFLAKCAEYGLGFDAAVGLLKAAGAPLSLGPIQNTDDILDPGKVSEGARLVTAAKDPNSGLNRAAFGTARLLKALNSMPESAWSKRRRAAAAPPPPPPPPASTVQPPPVETGVASQPPAQASSPPVG